MSKRMVALSLLLVLSFPLTLAAETDGVFQEQRRQEIHQLATKIMGSTFQTLQLSVEGATHQEALVSMGLALRQHLSACNISPLLCRCLHVIPILTNPEYALLERWGYTVHKSGDGSSRIVMTFDAGQLTQYALLNMWPLQLPQFKS